MDKRVTTKTSKPTICVPHENILSWGTQRQTKWVGPGPTRVKPGPVSPWFVTCFLIALANFGLRSEDVVAQKSAIGFWRLTTADKQRISSRRLAWIKGSRPKLQGGLDQSAHSGKQAFSFPTIMDKRVTTKTSRGTGPICSFWETGFFFPHYHG